MWEEAKPLAEAHHAEVDGGIEPRRPFLLDEAQMDAMCASGVLKIYTARGQDGKILGYFTWQVAGDIESLGLKIALQGAWYVAPAHPRVAYALAQFSLGELKALGVSNCYPHKRLQGRGAMIDRFWERQGAVPIQLTLSLWIGD